MIETGKSVSIEYTLSLDNGTQVAGNVGEEPLVYQHGEGQILPALEEALEGLEVGEEKKISLTAEEGYGPIDPEAFREVEKEAVPDDSHEIGTVLVARDGEGNELLVRVHEVRDEGIVLDLNHPLAGRNLHFKVRVLAIE